MPDLFERLLALLVGLPAHAVYWTIGGLAALENVFPPVPADTAVAIGAFLSRLGPISATIVFGVTFVSNVASATAVFVAGRALGRPFFTGRLGTRLLRPARLRRIERLYDRHGAWGIFASRFIPGVRAVVPPFAGIAGVPAHRALLPIVLASALWYGTLTFLVAAMADRIEQVARFVADANRIGLAVGVILGALGIWWARRHRNEVNR